MQCVILAGGLGSRLGNLTTCLPKCLIQINNIPFIDYQLRCLAAQEITKVILCIGYLGDLVKNHVKSGEQYGLTVEYVEDGEKLCGTGGALRRAFHKLENSFFVIYGDSYLPIDFKLVFQYYKQQSLPVLMTAFKEPGNLQLYNNLVYYDKAMNNLEYIDYGLSICTKKIVELIPIDEFYDLSTLFNNLSKENKIVGYQVFNKYYEIGSIEGIKEFTKYVNNHS